MMMLAAPTLQFVAQLTAERILNCAAGGLLIAPITWLVLRLVGMRNSGTRFAVWFAALSGIAALPLLGGWGSNGAELAERSEITMPASWALYIFLLWLIIAAAGLLRVGLGFWQLRRIRKSCVPVEVATLEPLLAKTLQEFDSRKPVKLCASDEVRVPTAIGFTEPLVAIPSWTMRELSTTELNAILLHELAHLRRRDDWTNLAQKVLGALLFFHPAVWWIEKKLALEREMACDDMVLAQTANPREYAECLVALAEKSFLRRGLALAHAAVDRLRNVSLRVSQILDTRRPSATQVWSPAAVLVTGVSLACLMALSHAPTRLVSFDDGAAVASASPLAASTHRQQMKPIAGEGMDAHLIPARLQFRPQEARPAEKARGRMIAESAVKGRLRNRTHGLRRSDVASELTSAELAQHSPKAPALVRASMTTDAVAAQELVFLTQTEVMQTRQYDASGAVWEICVWRVTVVGPVQNPMQKKIQAATGAKSI